MYQAIVVLSLLSTVFAQIELDGKCNFTSIAHKTNVNMTKLEGVWHKIKKVGNATEECDAINISPVLNKKNEYTISCTDTKVEDKKKHEGTLILDRAEVLKITKNAKQLNYVVLGTDYKTYLVLYSCGDKNLKKSVGAWILGRTVTLSKDAITATDALVKHNSDIAKATWTTISHDKQVEEVLEVRLLTKIKEVQEVPKDKEVSEKVTSGGVSFKVSNIIPLVGLLLLK